MQKVPEDHAAILAVSINGLPVDAGMLFLLDEDDHLYASAAFHDKWNLKQGVWTLTASDGTVYYELTLGNSLTYQWNQERAELAIKAEKEAFRSNRIDIGVEPATEVPPYTAGGYLNYDLAFTQSGDTDTEGAFLELVLFSGTGLFTSSLLATDTHSARLMTSWQTDHVDKSETLRIGDSYNTSSAWGLGVLYGGIQFGTNFELRPDYIPFATPTVAGNALLPSTVDVYVDNALRSHHEVHAGAFSIDNLPVITGAGDMQVVVTDLLGREQIMTQPFYVNPILLRPGLSMHSLELGWQRRDYGLQSNDYANPFAAVTYRLGVTTALTTEAHVEVLERQRTAGVAVAAKIPGTASVIETSVAASSVDGLDTGGMANLRFNFQGERWSANARMQLNSASFRQLGSDPLRLPKQIITGQLSAPLRSGTLSLNYVHRRDQNTSLTRVLNLNYSRRLRDSLQATFTLLKPLSGMSETVAQFTLLHVLGNNRIASATWDGQSSDNALYTQFQRATPRERGTGYRLGAYSDSRIPRQEAQLIHNESFGTLQADVVRIDGETSTRQVAQGSIASLGNGLFFTRNLGQGFAIVDTKGVAGVPVMLENQIVAHTDERGLALVNNVQPYQPNHISIDPLSLPMNAAIGAIVQTVVPRRCGCILVGFDVQQISSATLVIVLPDGSPLPAWSTVTVAGMGGEYIAAGRGEVFVDLPALTNNTVTARLADGRECTLQVDQPPTALVAPYLGPLQCVMPNR